MKEQNQENKLQLIGKISIRLPIEHKKLWQQESDKLNLSLSDFIRSKVKIDNFKPIITHKKTSKLVEKKCNYINVDPKLLNQIVRIGVNINQVARAINIKSSNINSIDLLSLFYKIEQHLDKLLKENSKC